jgi:molecular chaperone DnaJ
LNKDPYDVLGVDPSCSKEDILKAYRALASKYHPDRNPDSPKEAVAKFKEVSSAFEMIGDDDKRRQYDLYRSGGFPSFSFRSRNSVDEIFDNMFSQFFGDQGPSGSRIRVKVTLEEAYSGCSKKIPVERHEFCDPCKGTGSSSWDKCDKCGGKGFFVFSEGPMQTRSSCMGCGGRGSVSKDRCASCIGRGYLVAGVKELEIQIPRGAENGAQIRVVGEGHDGKDLYLVIVLEKHPRLERQGHFLLGRLEVPYSKMVLGGEVDFEALDSKISVRIPPKSKPGSRLKVKGKGMPLPQNPNLKGDLMLDLNLKIPKEITDEHRELLESLLKIES